MGLLHEPAQNKQRRYMIGVEVPGALVEQVMDHFVRECDIAEYLVHEDQRRIAEVPADVRVQAVPRHNDNEGRGRGVDTRARGDRFCIALKIAGGLRSSSRLAQLHPALPCRVIAPSVPVVVGRHVITTAAATVQQNDKNKNRSSHVAQG